MFVFLSILPFSSEKNLSHLIQNQFFFDDVWWAFVRRSHFQRFAKFWSFVKINSLWRYQFLVDGNKYFYDIRVSMSGERKEWAMMIMTKIHFHRPKITRWTFDCDFVCCRFFCILIIWRGEKKMWINWQ